MEIIKYIIHIIEFIFFIYFAFAAIYIFLFAFAGVFPLKLEKPAYSRVRKFAVLIPGYKEDAVILDVATEALKQNYPKDKFDVIIIADSFQPVTLKKLKELPIKLVEVSFELSTKSKALNKAMAEIGDNYDVALILDADNIMAPGFIQKINTAFDNGYKVVQGHRTAKNINTSLAILDAISEEVNNQIFRKGHRNLGFSSALIGSGMAFDYTFFKETMANVKAIGGFDKELEMKILKNKEKIQYVHDAIVRDEKVQKSEVFAKQRKRWLSAQFRVLQIGLTIIISVIYLLVEIIFSQSNWLFFSIQEWAVILGLVVLAFLLSIPGKFYNGKTFLAVLSLPKTFFLMFSSLFKLKGANKKFIHTEHGTSNKEAK